MNVVSQFPAAHDYDRDLRLQTMFEAAAIGIGTCELDGRIVEVNPAFSRMLGCSQEELAGSHAGELHPAWRGIFRSGNAMPKEAMPGDRLLGELLRGERNSFEMENLCRRKDGSEFWARLTVSLGRDARRQPAWLILLLADASERRRLEERLREVEKIEIIGRLAGGIAHDFNNLLTGILLYCDLMSAGLHSDGGAEVAASNSAAVNRESENDGWNDVSLRSQLRQHIEEMRLAGEQGAALTQQLLAIARKQAAEPRPVAINQIVTSTQNFLRRLIGEQIELALALDPALDSAAGLVLADPAQLRQILLNLVLNARDAMPTGGKIRVITRTAEFPDLIREREPGLGKVGSAKTVAERPGPASSGTRRLVSLTVRDNGCGMDAQTRGHLFEPFFTTKNPGQGTGLGLGTVERIVRAAGGRIEIESEAGRGTSIEVFLPVFDPVAQSSGEASSSRAGPEGGGP